MNVQFTKPGRSFKGAMSYYTHDKGRDGERVQTADRVAWSETRNLATDRMDIATRLMIATAQDGDRLKREAGIAATGRKAEKPVMAYSLAWHPNEKVDRAEMVRAANDSLRTLGLEKHQAVIVAHRDTKHPHVHVIVNRVDPETGRMATIRPEQGRKLAREWAHDYEQKRGQIVSPNRATKIERQAEQRREHPNPAERRAYVDQRRTERAQSSRDRRQAVRGAPSLEVAQRAAQSATGRNHSPATILRDLSSAMKDRHRDEWAALRGSHAARKAEIYGNYRGPMKDVIEAHKRDTKGDWSAHFKREKFDARERFKMEQTFTGRLSLAVVAAREQQRLGVGGNLATLTAANFLSRNRREATFNLVAARDRNALGERLAGDLAGKLKPLREARGREIGASVTDYKARAAELSERQAGERQKIREAWRQVGSDRTYRREQPEREAAFVQERHQSRPGATPQAPERKSAFDWLDRSRQQEPQKARQFTPEHKPDPTPEQKQERREVREPERKATFDWLDRGKSGQDRVPDPKVNRDRGRDERDR